MNNLNLKILLAEDVLGDVIKTLLDAKNGYDFTIVDSGRKAVIEAVENEYDCIIMDLLLPEMSGVRAIKLIREFDTDIPIIALSAIGNFKDEVINAGADRFIWKPPDFDRLHLMIYELVIEYRHKVSEKPGLDNRIIIKNKYRRLFLLKEKLALQGISADPSLIAEIEDLESELGKTPLH